MQEKIIEAVSRVVKSGNLSSLHGTEVHNFELEFKEYIGSDHAVAVNSGTAALHTALLTLGIKPGDEVICPAWTFVATASAILMCGAKPVFADIEKDSFNIDPHDILDKVTTLTRAIIAVHIAGIPCEMDHIMGIAKEHGLFVIEDACQALGSSYDGKKVGSIGDVGVFSFYPSKMISTGEGGMIVTNRNSTYRYSQAIRNHGQVGRYYSSTLGYNYRMTEIQGAMGRVTLSNIDEEIRRRNAKAHYIKQSATNHIKWPIQPKGADTAYSYFPVWFSDVQKYSEWYTPLYRMPMFDCKHTLPFTEFASKFGFVVPLL
jgi:perosamine synthetase